ncbi:DUF2393 family protein [Sulfurospirillum sp. 1612]|uniref:DUF2393 family protein n=1 Tax=Sulfurospirillum sp. 1612 TaxID=3094835 RepID=UPI002F93A149
MDDLRSSILLYIHHFTIYDYIAYGWLLVTFFLLLFLAVLLVRRSPKVSFLFIMLALVFLFAGPPTLKSMLTTAIRPIKINDIRVERLHFSQTLILNWKVQNLAATPLKDCKTIVTIDKSDDSIWSQLIHPSDIILQKTFYTSRIMKPNEVIENREIFNNFNNNDDINVSDISIKTECY